MLDMCMRTTSHGGKNGPQYQIFGSGAGLKISFSDYSGFISCLAGHDALLFDCYLYQIGIRNDISFISRFSEKWESQWITNIKDHQIDNICRRPGETADCFQLHVYIHNPFQV